MNAWKIVPAYIHSVGVCETNMTTTNTVCAEAHASNIRLTFSYILHVLIMHNHVHLEYI